MAWRFLWLRRLRGAPASPLLQSCRPTLPSLPTISSCSPKYSILADVKSSHYFEYRRIISRDLSSGLVSLVISDGKPKFEIQEKDPPKKHKWMTKKRLKVKRKKEKRKRREANKRDPRCIRAKGQKKKKFPTAEARIKYKIEKAKIKEALLVEKLKKYEVPQVQGPAPKEDTLTGEEKFYMKKMAQKRSNYVPIGRRGVFGGVILNMHLHWKKHETVKVFCKPCKLGQVHEYAKELARLSGGTPIEIIGKDTIVFYRGKNYVQPEVMSPVDTLSKKRALQKSKFEQSLETVRRFITIAEKELELYYRHIALYGDPNTRNSDLVYGSERKDASKLENLRSGLVAEGSDSTLSESLDGISSDDEDISGDETGLDSDFENFSDTEDDSDDESPTRFEVGTHEDLGERKIDFNGQLLKPGFDTGR